VYRKYINATDIIDKWRFVTVYTTCHCLNKCKEQLLKWIFSKIKRVVVSFDIKCITVACISYFNGKIIKINKTMYE